jgi:hypothetical protein
VSDERIAALPMTHGVTIGAAQILALLPGISRSGITIAAGLLRGLSHEDAARFSFLLATPVILLAGLLKIPDLFGPLGQGIGGAGIGRQSCLVRERLPCRPVPDALLRDEDPDAVCDLLRGGRARQPGLVVRAVAPGKPDE